MSDRSFIRHVLIWHLYPHVRHLWQPCQVFVHQNQYSKLTTHSKEGILLSHDTQAKGWRVYHFRFHRVIITKDVKIVESRSVIFYDSSLDTLAVSLPSLAFSHPLFVGPTPATSLVTSSLSTPISHATTDLPATSSPATTPKFLTYQRCAPIALPIVDSLDPPSSPPPPWRSTRIRTFPSHLDNYAACCHLQTRCSYHIFYCDSWGYFGWWPCEIKLTPRVNKDLY
jgi:hypothetical protein